MHWFLAAFGLLVITGLSVYAVIGVSRIDFARVSISAYENSLRVFASSINNPAMARLLQLESFRWCGLSQELVLLVQGGIVVLSILLSVVLHSPILVFPLFFAFREIFALVAMFLRDKLKIREYQALERMLRSYLVIFAQTRSKRETLAQVSETQDGVWGIVLSRLFRRLGNNDTSACYTEVVESFPNNSHVRLFAQVLQHSDSFGGEIRNSIDAVLSDVTADRMALAKNKSVTSTSVYVVMVLNAIVFGVTVYNFIGNPSIMSVFTTTLSGSLLFALAIICAGVSLKVARNIATK